MSIIVCGFYRFVAITDLPETRAWLLGLLACRGIKGTILVAPEGINGTIAGLRAAIDEVQGELERDARFSGLRFRESMAEIMPFQRLKVRLKKEIIALRIPDADPTERVGQYVEAEEWNALISDPETLVVDTRNAYEIEEGTFQRALDPKTLSFGQFPAWVDKNLNPQVHRKVAMFCTGGIRCEKATALLLAKGFENVYHLKGGILHYLDVVAPEDSLYEGKCFVFDERRVE